MPPTEDKTVLPNRLGGGPHGLGDPDDKSLRKVESDVLIPKKIREKSRKEKCIPEVKEFEACCKDSGLLMVVKCRKENSALISCLDKWFHDENLIKQCTDEYLRERTDYRRTGIPLKDKLKMASENHS